jgi:hypothetical protein
MSLKTEIILEKPKILIISKINYPFINLLKKYLDKYGADIFISPEIPPIIEKFNYCFFINDFSSFSPKFLKSIPLKKIKTILIVFNNKKNLRRISLPNELNQLIKIIEVQKPIVKEEEIDKILWFSFSSASENYLKLYPLPLTSTKLPKKEREFFAKKIFHRLLTPKRFLLFISIFCLLFHTLYLFPLMISLSLKYHIVSEIKKERISTITNPLKTSQRFTQVSYQLYRLVRPSYLFFSMAILPDNLFDILFQTEKVIEKGYQVYLNAKEMKQLFLKKNKNELEKKYFSLRIETLNKDVEILVDQFNLLNQKIPANVIFFKEIREELLRWTDALNKLKQVLVYHDKFFVKDKKNKYLVFFANNRELRPGGGFIGSFGVIEIKDFTLEDIKIYDVYDADGQLKAHFEPPEPIKKYLKIPHWFLRDSNFSPDFFENYQQAKIFLENELGLKDFSGAILITTSMIEKTLKAFGDIYLPDFNENINSNNFYLKAQFYSEKNFFPGSIQKKNFLAAVTRQVIMNLENVSLIKLFQAINDSLNEKQMVVFFEDKSLQKLFSSWYWDGRLIDPSCQNFNIPCLSDYLLFYDANLGVNKANYYLNRIAILKIKIDDNGNISHRLSIQYQNESPSENFPGGIYRNYFQVLLPKKSKIKQITKDSILVENYEEEEINVFFKRIGFFFEVAPKKSSLIKIDYQIPYQITSDRQIYQLIIQKQIGATNSDLILEFNFPENFALVNKNFLPLANEKNIIYNTNLDTDKIFFLELKKY